MNCLGQVVLVYFVTGVVWTKWWPRYCFAPVHSFYLFLLFSLTVSRNTQLSWTLTKLVRTLPQCVHCVQPRGGILILIILWGKLGSAWYSDTHYIDTGQLGRGGGGSNLTVGFVRSRVNGVTLDHNSWGKFGVRHRDRSTTTTSSEQLMLSPVPVSACRPHCVIQ